MTSNQYPYDSTWEQEDWSAPILSGYHDHAQKPPVELAAILLALFIAAALGWGALGLYGKTSAPSAARPAATSVDRNESSDAVPGPPLLLPPEEIIAPYDQYVLTQGIHGLSYGHMAIDIAAGKGSLIKSPISGRVSNFFIDGVGNPTLVLENDHYIVTLLHGIYTVRPGDVLSIGDKIGTESNQGNTRDMQGHSCRDRDCGYHTHLNIFDKTTQTNIDPLTVIGNLASIINRHFLRKKHSLS